ncbi:translocation/assembly module TamB domain-containing protein [Changchengzhania lutea]|uniref:translocation/assembly module TamB domain-containing protein n=1 Tax=Changchengzhania lutea TaxID=2049305 RepID=UPI00163DA31E|nr:translocation/assembly module TamB domain-containing protein [Changchengzhania lutea]
MLILAIPAVQTQLGRVVTKRINNDFGTNINIDKIGLQFNGDVELKDIYIEDYKQDTLISIAELNTSIISFRNVYNGKLVFGDIDIIDLFFNVKTYIGESNTNLDVFVAKFDDDNPRDKKSSFLLASSDVSIYNGTFKLSDQNRETSKVLDFNKVNINATNFLINGSDVSARINKLSFKDTRGLTLKNMMTDFSYTLADMTFGNLQIETPHSVLKGDLKFSYNREDFKEFADKVEIKASFRDSNLLLDELNVFYNEFGENQIIKFSSDISGTLNELKTTNLRLDSNRNTRVYGDISFKNLFNKEVNNFYMDGQFSNLSSTYRDLRTMLPNVLGEAIPSSFSRLGRFTIVGNTQVSTTKVIANVRIRTDLGLVDSDLEISKIDDIDNAGYKGNVVFDDFDFGTFLNDPNVGRASLNFDVDGQGFVMEKINTQVIGDVFKVEYNNYTYTGVKVLGNIKNNIFNGNLITDDKNLKLNFTGLVDFSEKLNKYDFEAVVSYANLKELNFYEKDSISIFESTVKMNMNSSNYDDAYGNIAFTNTVYKNEHDTYYFDQFDMSSTFEDGVRLIKVESPDIIEGQMKGDFRFRDIPKLFENSVGSIYTNYQPHEVRPDQVIDFNFKIYNKIVEVFYPEIELGKNTFIRGRVETDERKFKLTFKSPKIILGDNYVDNATLQVDNGNPVFNTYVEIDSLSTKYYDVSKFNLINVTVNDTLFMRSEFNGGKRSNDKFNLSFYHTINEENKSVVGFKTSDVTIKENKWFINEENNRYNKVTFSKDLTSIDIDQFRINHNNEEIKLSGFIKDSTQKDLKLNFKNVDLAKITPNIDSLSLAGNVNGKLDILQKNGTYLPNSTVVIDDFQVNDYMLGSFDASVTGNADLTNYTVDATIKNDVAKSFSAKGDINVNGRQSIIDVDVVFNKFNLQPLNPLLQDVLSDIRGLVTGKVDVVGNLRKPDINGDLTIYNGGMGVPFLNVDYKFDNKASVTLKNQSFIFNSIQLTDTKYNSKGLLNGSLSHINFSKWSLGLYLSTSRLLVLDTKEAEESLYYGTGFLGGTASITGPTDQLNIDVVGETKYGTVFKIPLNNTESFGDNSFIHFITKEEKQARENGEAFTFNEVKGVELSFDLDLTEAAEVEIIIDKNTGHSLKGRGRGGLLIEINTNGKFDMWGDFSVFEGVYNFAFGGVIQKEFSVEPGGTIAWEGDPLDAIINMRAIYKTQANPSPLLDNPINRSIPVELNIALTGNLEQPKPDFTFEFPNVNSTIKSELQYRLESSDDRENQALYLISTGSFSRGLNELNFSGTIAERLNGIINGIFTSDDSKINIGLNYEAGENRPDYKTGDRFGVTLQTQISDRVLINGKVGVPVGGAAASETVIAGDVEISFLLNEEGTLTANVFNRENSIRNFGEAIGYTQGVGLSYSVDFNTFRELIQNFFKKTDSEAEENLIIDDDVPTTENPLPDFVTIKSSTNE